MILQVAILRWQIRLPTLPKLETRYSSSQLLIRLFLNIMQIHYLRSLPEVSVNKKRGYLIWMLPPGRERYSMALCISQVMICVGEVYQHRVNFIGKPNGMTGCFR